MTMYFDRHEDEIAPLTNPLDSVEDVLSANNWTFNRMNDDELMVQVIGKTGEYRLFFIWQENLHALQFCAQYDLSISPNNLAPASAALLAMNEHLWMGHFDLPKDTKIPTYRYTGLFRGLGRGAATEAIEDMVDISLAQCERYYPVFTFLSGAETIDDQHLSLALMETVGES